MENGFLVIHISYSLSGNSIDVYSCEDENQCKLFINNEISRMINSNGEDEVVSVSNDGEDIYIVWDNPTPNVGVRIEDRWFYIPKSKISDLSKNL